MLNALSEIVNNIYFYSATQAAVILLLGFGTAKIVSRLVIKALNKKLTSHQSLLIKRIIFYTIFILFFISSLQQLGFHLGALLGAAGILTVAVGFASQTSVSNIISGLFLLIEKPFRIGDVLQTQKSIGTVTSIGLLSTNLRTFDNLFVRIPNETLIKSEITNFSRYPKRRFDLLIGVAYKESIENVGKVLNDIAANNKYCLKDPAPSFVIKGFGESSIDLQFSVWATQKNFSALKNTLQQEVKTVFEEKGIDIPFPQRQIQIIQ